MSVTSTKPPYELHAAVPPASPASITRVIGAVSINVTAAPSTVPLTACHVASIPSGPTGTVATTVVLGQASAREHPSS